MESLSCFRIVVFVSSSEKRRTKWSDTWIPNFYVFSSLNETYLQRVIQRQEALKTKGVALEHELAILLDEGCHLGENWVKALRHAQVSVLMVPHAAWVPPNPLGSRQLWEYSRSHSECYWTESQFRAVKGRLKEQQERLILSLDKATV